MLIGSASVARMGRPMRPLVAVFAALALLSVAGCGHNVGDSCRVNVDCDPLGQRVCDISAPGGYCTIEGCDSTSCPDEAVCVRFFQPIPGRPCTPGVGGVGGGAACLPSERCLCDCVDSKNPDACVLLSLVPAPLDAGVGAAPILRCVPGAPATRACASDDECASAFGRCVAGACTVGHCAPESSEHRFCEKKCSSDGDCRPEYHCVRTGTNGALPVPDHSLPDGGVAPSVSPPPGFCVQRASTCTDGTKDGSETDVDCGGGGACPRCAVGKSCQMGSDCTNGICIESQCR